MNFNELMFGRRNLGEYELRWALREHGYFVDDVSAEPAYWSKDIDMLIAPVFGEDVVTSIEVKWDQCTAATGNIFIELENPRSFRGEGWFKFCEADYLAYGDAKNRIFYFIKMNDLRTYINNNKLNLRYHTTWDGSYGYLLKLKDISELISGTLKV